MQTLRRLLEGDWRDALPIDGYPSPVYGELRSLDDYYSVRPPRTALPYTDVGVATETDGGDGGLFNRPVPWSLQLSFAPGTGWLIAAGNRTLLDAISQDAPLWRTVGHNLDYDFPVSRDLGVLYNYDTAVDTMVEAFHAGYTSGGKGVEDDGAGGSGGGGGSELRQLGLKYLALRLASMRMTSFTDLVTEYAFPEVERWLVGVADILRRPLPPTDCGACGHAKDAHKNGRGRCGACDTCSRYRRDTAYEPPHEPDLYVSARRKAGRLLGDMQKARETGAALPNPWRRRGNWEDEEQEFTEFLQGGQRFPSPRISLVPRDKAIQYAGRDADASLRVWRKLEAIQRGIEGSVC